MDVALRPGVSRLSRSLDCAGRSRHEPVLARAYPSVTRHHSRLTGAVVLLQLRKASAHVETSAALFFRVACSARALTTLFIT